MTDDEARPTDETDGTNDTVDTVDDAVVAVADDEQPRAGLLSSKRFLVAVAAATVALIVAVVFGVLLLTTRGSDQYEVADTRNKAIEAAKQGVTAYTEIDHKNPDNFRNSQRAISTDDLFDTMEKGWTKTRDAIKKTELSVKVQIIDTGIAELNTHKGDAVALASIKITRSLKGQQEQSGVMRMIAKLKRVGDEWKLADIAEAPQVGDA